MSEQEESFGCFATAWVNIGIVASFIGLPLAAYLLWDEHRGLAWLAIVGLITGIVPHLGLPVAAGFIVYALTENLTRSLFASAVAIAIEWGPLILADYLGSRRQKDSISDDWVTDGTQTNPVPQEVFEERPFQPHPNVALPISSTSVTSINEWSRYCGQCGAPIIPDAKFCESCGSRLVPRDSRGATLSAIALQPAVSDNPNQAVMGSQPVSVASRSLNTRKLLSFEGRMARKDFIVFSAILWLAFVPLVFLAGWAQTDSCPQPVRPNLFSHAACSDGEALVNQYKYLLVFALLVLWCAISWTADVRRSHDFEWSGWAAFILSIIPIVGMIFYATLFIRRGDSGINRYGIPNSGTPFPALHH